MIHRAVTMTVLASVCEPAHNLAMAMDVVDLRGFYLSPLGQVATQYIGAVVNKRWSQTTGLSIAGIGYAPPYLEHFRGNALRVLAFMPAAQGVLRWPSDGPCASALVDTSMLPLPDDSMDRILVVHALEVADWPSEMMNELWRVLAPGGRLLLVTPSRNGVWARSDTTPFGYGQPFSRGQLRDLLRAADFSPMFWGEALYIPPFKRPSWLRSAAVFERIGGRLALPGAGVHVVEATKQVFRPVTLRRAARRLLPQLNPAAAASRR